MIRPLVFRFVEIHVLLRMEREAPIEPNKRGSLFETASS